MLKDGELYHARTQWLGLRIWELAAVVHLLGENSGFRVVLCLDFKRYNPAHFAVEASPHYV